MTAQVPGDVHRIAQRAAGGTRSRLFGGRRRWWVPASVAVGLCGLVLLGLLVIYPKVGARKLRQQLTAKLEAKLGREVAIGDIDVRLGHATVADVEIRGPNDGELPLVRIERIEIEFAALPSLVGSVRLGEVALDGVTVTMRRHADGRDNVSDIVERVTKKRDASDDSDDSSSGPRPTAIRVTRGKLVGDDGLSRTTLVVNDGDAEWHPGELIAQGRNVIATSVAAPRAAAGKVDLRKLEGQPPTLSIDGGEVSLWPELALTGIAGTVLGDPQRPGQFKIDMAGGYGGVPGKLWTARGPLDWTARTASIELEADKFQLDRLAPLLAKSPVVDYAQTSIDTRIHLELARAGIKFAGEFHLHGLNVGHPMIADRDVHNLDLSGKVAGSFDRGKRQFTLDQGDFVTRDVPFSLTGSVTRAPVPASAAELTAKTGPIGARALALRLVIPPIDCQRMLKAIPTEMAPYLNGYKLNGVFDTDIEVDIDWDNLDATKLGGKVGIRQCKVLNAPADSAKRLQSEFEHYVEVEKGKWHSFTVGPSNPDYVPFDQISPYLVKSIMSTEDSAFYQHRGFITSEFRTALVSNLKNEQFKHGASSITMQMVKNVMLYRDKTLARKLQELFLTWHVENTLDKDRILEIYFNVIEYGPWLYGIGPATRHYFGKNPKDLNPVEAAFFSTILPSPKERYKQYCAGTVTASNRAWIDRILGVMLKRDRLTQEEYDNALATPLLFVKSSDETEDECMARTQKTIRNSRSTNPMKK